MTILGPRDQLESLHQISVEVAAIRELPRIYDRALTHCLALTRSAMGFVGLLLLVDGAFARILDGECRGNHRYLGQTTGVGRGR